MMWEKYEKMNQENCKQRASKLKKYSPSDLVKHTVGYVNISRSKTRARK